MLNVGVIGIGNIAQKAYLPEYAKMQDNVQWFLMSRDLAKVTRIGNAYRMVVAGSSLEDLDKVELDAVMIHAATASHYELVKHFLTRNVNVFVDKPLALTMDEVTELYLLAAQHQKLLTVGFNRRFAPAMQPLLQLPDKNLIQVVKNRVAKPLEPRQALFEELIHPLDTALALAGFPSDPKARYTAHRDKDGNLEQAGVTFTANGIRGEASLNLVAGANLEEATVASPAGIFRVQDLSRSTTYQGTTAKVINAPDWQGMLTTRGFAPMIQAFLAAVRDSTTNPVAPESSRLTHQLIADLAAQL